MDADARRRPRRDALRLSALLMSGGVLLAGCASMPDSGDVRAVKASPRADSQVRVYAVQPRPGADPGEIVAGFLEAITSDDANFVIAKTYLTPETAKTWRPEAGTTVLEAAPDRGASTRGDSDNPGMDYLLIGKQIARVDSQHAYQAITPTDYRSTIHLSQQNGPDGKEWRIDKLPEGLVLGASDFERNYRPVNKYYFAAGRNHVVADPIFIRQRMDPITRMDPVTQSVKALLDGPTNWLKPVVESPFPKGTALRKGVTSLTFDDRNVLKVPLNDKASNVGQTQCDRMAAQILFTLKDLSATRVEQVELQRSDNSQLCVRSSGTEEGYAPDHALGGTGKQYFIDHDKSRLAVLPDDAKNTPAYVPGPFGTGQVPMSKVAVARDERRAAAVSKDSRRLHVASIDSEGEPATTVVQSRGKTESTRLSAPSWDRNQDLWIADRDPAHPALLRLANGGGPAQKVEIVEGLDGARIDTLRVSADGARIALLLEKDGRTALKIGRVERRGPKDNPVVSIADLLSVAPQMETVTAVSWAGPSRLVVVAKESGGVQQVLYLQTDGSTSATSVLPGLNGVTAVAASNEENRPLVAHSEGDGIVRLPAGAGWQTVVPKGSSPIYPG
ncbi:LpqB family beta-propeller domain-containing protein [Streptomyces sp. NPDC020965]|uniref:LpqB family beta-propeller domain-containing protein n=1 Tax=Streptomyces sp. NPDC020965 TaxID=3365105 RepID=UPI0037BDD284